MHVAHERMGTVYRLKYKPKPCIEFLGCQKFRIELDVFHLQTYSCVFFQVNGASYASSLLVIIHTAVHTKFEALVLGEMFLFFSCKQVNGWYADSIESD